MFLGLIFYVVLDVVLYRWAVNSESNLARYVFSYFFTGTICVIPFLLFPGLYNDITMSVFSILFLVGFFIVKKKMKEIIQTSKAREQSEFMQSGKISMSNPEVAAMINEAVDIMCEIKKIPWGLAYQCSNSEFEGKFFTFFPSRSIDNKTDALTITIHVYNVTLSTLEKGVADWRQHLNSIRYSKAYDYQRELPELEALEQFMHLFRKYYSPSEKAYIYTTSHSIRVPKGINIGQELKALLYGEFEKKYNKTT